MIAVTGASGFVGGSVVSHLLAMGESVRILTRSRSRAEERLGAAAAGRLEIVEGDVAEPEALARLLGGAGAVVHLAAAVSQGPASRDEVFRTNVLGATALIRACRREGVDRAIVASTHVVRLRSLGDYARSKRVAEHLFLDSPLRTTVLRLNMVYGPGSEGMFPRLVAAVRGSPVVPVIGSGETEVRPVLVDDIAHVVAACLRSDAACGKVYDVGGPDALSFEEFLVEIMNAVGTSKRRLHVPWAAAQAIARVGEAVLPRPPLTRDNVSYFVPWPPCKVAPLRRELAVSLTPLRQGLQRVLAGEPSPA